MHIANIIYKLTQICVYYYIAYHEKIRGEHVTVSNRAFNELRNRIYNFYMQYTDGYVYDVEIMYFPWGQQYILNDEDINFYEAMNIIDRFIDYNRENYNTEYTLVIQISNHPLDNYISFTHNWIKWCIDLYRF